MIQDSVNQMLGSLAIGSRLITDAKRYKQQDTANLINAETQNFKSGVQSRNKSLDTIKALQKENRSIEEVINTNKDLNDEQLLNLQQDSNDNQSRIDELQGKVDAYDKEIADAKNKLLKGAKLKETKPGEVESNDKENTFVKGLQADVIKTLRDAGVENLDREQRRAELNAKDIDRDTISNLKGQLSASNKELNASNKAKMSMVRKAKQKVAQANNNFITNFGNIPMTSQLGMKIQEQLNKGGQQ